MNSDAKTKIKMTEMHTSFRFSDLPCEVQLQVIQALQDITTERELLQLRLVSSQMNTLILDPTFWHTITFSKQRYFKTGTGHGSNIGLSQNRAGETGRHMSMSALQPNFFHSSDANIIIHRQSWAATMLGSSSSLSSSLSSSSHPSSTENERGRAEGIDFDAGHPTQPSLSITANIPSFIYNEPLRSVEVESTPQRQSQHSWRSIGDSFLMFISRLASQPQTAAYGIRELSIEEWENDISMKALWTTLAQFNSLRSLSVKKSALQCLSLISTPVFASLSAPIPIPAEEYESLPRLSVGLTPFFSWEHLTRLELKDCVGLVDLSGILELMPRLEDLNLDGCTGLIDFSPLVRVSSARRHHTHSSQIRQDTQDDINVSLSFKTINLTQTKIRDHELIELLRVSPYLRELRLDQCYRLTDASLMGIGYRDTSSIMESSQAEVLESNQDPNLENHEQYQHGAATPLPFPPPQRITKYRDTSTSFCPNLQILSLKNCCDLTDDGVRALAGCHQLELLIIRGLRNVREETIEWLHSQGVPLRKALDPLGHWRHWQEQK